MSLAEGVQGSIIYKAYSTGVITANTQPVSTVDPAVRQCADFAARSLDAETDQGDLSVE
jgi:hypothetical protein